MLLGRRKPRDAPKPFRAPDGERIYAIGDIHGRLDLLYELIDLIDVDHAARGHVLPRLLFLGDLVDRGPDSAGVVTLARRLAEANDRVTVIKGNHEEVLIEAARGDRAKARLLIELGGVSTLLSYGLTEAEIEQGNFQNLADLLRERLPSEDIDFLERSPDMLVFGDYVFVHAGIRPGTPLDEQEASDLRWIRGPFLQARRGDGYMVVHGHTPTREIDIADDRIGIDTRAYDSGVLTAIGIEGTERWFLQTGKGQLSAPQA